MKLTCPHCQNILQLDDAKVPAGQFKIKCPKCTKIITSQKDASQAAESAAASIPERIESGDDQISPGVRQFIESEVAAMKKEITGAMVSFFGEGKWEETEESKERDQFTAKKALVCEDDQSFVDLISGVARKLGYSVDVANNTVDAIKKVDSGYYQMVTVESAFPDDPEGGAKILAKLNAQKPAQRRQTFVVLISSTVKSADANAAFFLGANITINKAEIKNLDAVIREGQRHFQQMYAMFNRILDEKESHV